MDGQTNRKIIGNKLQRKPRNTATDAERRLWQYLRNRQLEGCKFRRQHPFADYLLDFASLDRNVGIELDSVQHADNVRQDKARTGYLDRCGYRLLRFWNNEVFENIEGVVEVILSTLAQRAAPSPPHPPHEGEG